MAQQTSMFYSWKCSLNLCLWNYVFTWKSAFLQDSCQLFYGQNCFLARDDSPCRWFYPLWEDSIPFEMILSQNKYCRRRAWCNSVLRYFFYLIQLSSTQLLSHVRLCDLRNRQASLSITKSWSPPKPMSIESVMSSNHLILCRPLLLLPSIFPSIRVFSNESALCIRWPKYWSSNFNISPSNKHPGLISFRMDWLDLLAAF